MEKIKLEQIIKYVNGLNIMTNAGVGIKDVEVAFDISLFKVEGTKLLESFQEVAKTVKGKEEEKEAKLRVLLDKEYEIELPAITLDLLKDSKEEIPLVVFDYLQGLIKKKK